MWFNRNGVVHGQNMQEAVDIASFAADYPKRYVEARLQFHTPRPPEQIGGWTPPTGSNTIKVNFDGAFSCRDRRATIGVVARNCSGEVLYWVRRKLQGAQGAEIAESWAAVEAVRLAVRMGWQNIVVEGDCACVIHNLQSSSPILSSSGVILEEIRLDSHLFSSIVFHLISRKANTLAHFMAQDVCEDSEGVVLPANAPSI